MGIGEFGDRREVSARALATYIRSIREIMLFKTAFGDDPEIRYDELNTMAWNALLEEGLPAEPLNVELLKSVAQSLSLTVK